MPWLSEQSWNFERLDALFNGLDGPVANSSSRRVVLGRTPFFSGMAPISYTLDDKAQLNRS